MPAYAYPIAIKRRKQVVQFNETVTIDSNSLTLEALAFVGKDAFVIYEIDGWGGYEVSVDRSRLETDEEQQARVQREESYMLEYNKRHLK